MDCTNIGEVNKTYFIYILCNKYNNVLYIGVSHDLYRRILEHKNKYYKGFTAKYNINKLVYYEVFGEIEYAIHREKQLKCWSRKKKFVLLAKYNSQMKDLSDVWYD